MQGNKVWIVLFKKWNPSFKIFSERNIHAQWMRQISKGEILPRANYPAIPQKDQRAIFIHEHKSKTSKHKRDPKYAKRMIIHQCSWCGLWEDRHLPFPFSGATEDPLPSCMEAIETSEFTIARNNPQQMISWWEGLAHKYSSSLIWGGMLLRNMLTPFPRVSWRAYAPVTHHCYWLDNCWLPCLPCLTSLLSYQSFFNSLIN